MKSLTRIAVFLPFFLLGLWACNGSKSTTPSGCTPGYPDCSCAAGEACLTGFSCQNAKCAATVVDGDSEADQACTPGYPDCACAANNACLLGLVCQNAKCVTETVDGDKDEESCIPGYEGCVCALNTACLSGLHCENAKCVVTPLDGDTDNDTESENTESESETEVTACTCPDYTGYYCLDPSFCLSSYPTPKTSNDWPHDAMIIVEPTNLDPLSCEARIVISTRFGIPYSKMVDRCNFPTSISIADNGPTLLFSSELRAFAFYGPEGNAKRTSKDVVECHPFPAEERPDEAFSREACPEIHCYDGAMNHGESDTDCGGTCEPCINGLGCWSDNNCLSTSCINGFCADSYCGDGYHDTAKGLETCDDGNTEAGDGCNADCGLENDPGWECTDDMMGKTTCTCNVAKCPSDPQAPCKAPICTTHGCDFEIIAAGNPAPNSAQLSGDCANQICNSDMTTSKVYDGSDTPPPPVCQSVVCNEELGMAVLSFLPPGAPCHLNGVDGMCNGSGGCIPLNK